MSKLLLTLKTIDAQVAEIARSKVAFNSNSMEADHKFFSEPPRFDGLSKKPVQVGLINRLMGFDQKSAVLVEEEPLAVSQFENVTAKQTMVYNREICRGVKDEPSKSGAGYSVVGKIKPTKLLLNLKLEQALKAGECTKEVLYAWVLSRSVPQILDIILSQKISLSNEEALSEVEALRPFTFEQLVRRIKSISKVTEINFAQELCQKPKEKDFTFARNYFSIVFLEMEQAAAGKKSALGKLTQEEIRSWVSGSVKKTEEEAETELDGSKSRVFAYGALASWYGILQFVFSGGNNPGINSGIAGSYKKFGSDLWKLKESTLSGVVLGCDQASDFYPLVTASSGPVFRITQSGTLTISIEGDFERINYISNQIDEAGVCEVSVGKNGIGFLERKELVK